MHFFEQLCAGAICIVGHGTNRRFCNLSRGAQPRLTAGAERRLTMTKFLIGVATAALWFALTYAAKAEPACHQGGDNGVCVSLVSGR